MSFIYTHDGDINKFLNGVHDAIINNYLKGLYNQKNSNELIQNASILERFLRDLKRESGQKKKSKNITFNLVKNEVNKTLGRGATKYLFQTSYDKHNKVDPFEEEMTALLYAITKNIAIEEEAEKLTLEDFSLGSKQVTVDLEKKYLKEWSEIAIKQCAEQAEKEFTYSDKWGNVVARSGKPDSQGVEVTIKADANPELLKIYDIIKNAKFSEKNYQNMYWDKKNNKSIPGSSSLHLSQKDSNALKAYYGVLTDLGYSKESAVVSFYHAYGCWKKKDHGHGDVEKNILRIRQVYELIGSGSGFFENGEFKTIGKVDYLIFNVPDSKDEIYVKSVPEILQNLFDLVKDVDVFGNPFTQRISVSKSIFRETLKEIQI